MDSVFIALKDASEVSGWFSTESISLLIALIAVFFAPIIAHFTAMRTIKSQTIIAKEQMSVQNRNAERAINVKVLSTNRQNWINTLRDNISEILSIMHVGNVIKVSDNDFIATCEKVFTLRNKISLLLNPNEDDHKKLDNLIENGVENFFTSEKSEYSGKDYGTIKKEILDISKIILKREWERAKSLN